MLLVGVGWGGFPGGLVMVLAVPRFVLGVVPAGYWQGDLLGVITEVPSKLVEREA